MHDRFLEDPKYAEAARQLTMLFDAPGVRASPADVSQLKDWITTHSPRIFEDSLERVGRTVQTPPQIQVRQQADLIPMYLADERMKQTDVEWSELPLANIEGNKDSNKSAQHTYQNLS